MRKIDSDELTAKTTVKGATKRPSHYDWDRLFDGQVWEMIEGIDFPGSARAFSTNTYSVAKARGLKVTIRNPAAGVLWIQAHREAK